MAQTRTISLDDIFRDLAIITEANMIMKSMSRMEAIRMMRLQQEKALVEAEVHTPLIDSLPLSAFFKVVR